MTCTRRQILVGFFGLATGGAVASAFGCRRRESDLPARAPPPFEPGVLRTLEAAMDRALPGAVEAGVPDHMATWIAKDPYFAGVKREFALAAQHLDRVARQMHQKDFAACAGDAQDAVLRRFQKGEIKLANFDGAAFFANLVTLTLEGFLGDPKYGGNRGGAGWQFIGFKPCWWSPRTLERVVRPDEGFHD